MVAVVVACFKQSNVQLGFACLVVSMLLLLLFVSVCSVVLFTVVLESVAWLASPRLTHTSHPIGCSFAIVYFELLKSGILFQQNGSSCLALLSLSSKQI